MTIDEQFNWLFRGIEPAGGVAVADDPEPDPENESENESEDEPASEVENG